MITRCGHWPFSGAVRSLEAVFGYGFKRVDNGVDAVQWRDLEAVERLLAQPPRDWFWTPTVSNPELDHRLAAAVELADANRRLTALLCETANPTQKYLVVRLVDLPHLTVAVYERLIGGD